MLGFCFDKSLLPVIEGIKNKDKYESVEIDPTVDLPIELIQPELKFYLDNIKTHCNKL